MADIAIGDITARLRADSSQFDQALQQAQQRLRSLTDALTQQRTVQTGTQQSTNQLAAAYLAMARAISEQTQGYTQAQAATLAYRREQDALRESLRQQRDAQRAAAEATQQAQRAWQGMLQVAGGIGLATSIGAITSAIKNMVTEAVTLSARMQDLNFTFQAIEGSTQAANSRMATLFQTAQRLGVDFVSAAEAFRRFDAAAQGTALQGQGVARAFEGLLVGARVLGTSSEEARRATAALEQMLSKGRVSAEELRQQLAEAVPGAARLMAEGLGVSTRALEQMLQTGLLPADAAVIAFTDRMRQLGEAAGPSGGPARMSSVFAQLKNETTA